MTTTPIGDYTYLLNNDKTATLTGTTLLKTLSALVIPDTVTNNTTIYTVTSIGINVFKNFSALTSLTLPTNLTSIEESAFEGCNKLTSLNIPNSVMSIGEKAFYGCNVLQSLTIPNSVTSIGNYAFYGCNVLESLTIPNSVTSISTLTSIGSYAFRSCSALTSLILPDSVASIGDGAFKSCSALTSLTLSNNLNTINYHAFYGCKKLTSLTIPDSLETIGEKAFAGCRSLTLSKNSNLRSIGNSAFYYLDLNLDVGFGCEDLTSLILPDTVMSIGSYAFKGCKNLTSLILPKYLTSIGDFAFEGCNKLTSLTIPDSLTTIGIKVFYNCNGLTSLTFSVDSTLTSIGEDAFENCNKLTSLTLPDSLTTIGGYAFAYCNSLTSLIIPTNLASLASIGNSAFNGCNKLTSLILPDSVTSIGGEAFISCNALTSLTLPINSSLTTIGYNAFGYCYSLKSLTIPNSVTSIGEKAFYDCNNLISLTLPDSLTSIGNTSETSSFYNCYALTSLILPNSLTYIGKDSFKGCYSLKSLILPNNNSTIIGENAFYSCISLKNVTIPDNVNIGNNAFEHNNNELNISNENIPETIGYYVKYVLPTNNTGLDFIKDIITYIYNNDGTATVSGVINTTTSLTSVSIPTTVIDSNIPNGYYTVTSIDTYAFSGYVDLTSVTFPDTLTSIGDQAFNGCNALTSITLPKNLTTIGGYAFYSTNTTNTRGFCDYFWHKNINNINNLTISTDSGLVFVPILANGKYTLGQDSLYEINEKGDLYIDNQLANGNYKFQHNVWMSSDVTGYLYIDGKLANGNYKKLENGMYISSSSNTDEYLYKNGVKIVNTKSQIEGLYTGSKFQVNTTQDDLSLSGIKIGATYTLLKPDIISKIVPIFPIDTTDIYMPVLPYAYVCIDTYYWYCSNNETVYKYKYGEEPTETVFTVSNWNITKSIKINNQSRELIGRTNCIFSRVKSVTIDTIYTYDLVDTFYNYTTLTNCSTKTSITDCSIKTSITDVDTTYTVTSIGDNAFYDCIALTSLTLPNTLTSIGVKSFYGNALSSITIPPNVTSIEFIEDPDNNNNNYAFAKYNLSPPLPPTTAYHSSNFNPSNSPNSDKSGLDFTPINSKEIIKNLPNGSQFKIGTTDVTDLPKLVKDVTYTVLKPVDNTVTIPTGSIYIYIPFVNTVVINNYWYYSIDNKIYKYNTIQTNPPVIFQSIQSPGIGWEEVSTIKIGNVIHHLFAGSAIIGNPTVPIAEPVQVFKHGSIISDLVVDGVDIKYYKEYYTTNGPTYNQINDTTTLLTSSFIYVSQTDVGEKLSIEVFVNKVKPPIAPYNQLFNTPQQVVDLSVKTTEKQEYTPSLIYYYRNIDNTDYIKVDNILEPLKAGPYQVSQQINIHGKAYESAKIDIMVRSKVDGGNDIQIFNAGTKVKDLAYTRKYANSTLKYFIDSADGDIEIGEDTYLISVTYKIIETDTTNTNNVFNYVVDVYTNTIQKPIVDMYQIFENNPPPKLSDIVFNRNYDLSTIQYYQFPDPTQISNTTTELTGYYPYGITETINGIESDRSLVEFFIKKSSTSTPCFNENTKILCLKNDIEEYVLVQNLKKGDLVKTYSNLNSLDYKKIVLTGKGELINNPDVWSKCMYKMGDLIVTGGHSILLDELSEEDKEKEELLNRKEMVDDKRLVWAGLSHLFTKLDDKNTYTYYHFVLEDEETEDNRLYGVWANGVLVETIKRKDFFAYGLKLY